MARSAMTPVASSEAGIDLTAVDSAINTTDGISFPWTPTRKIWILNGDDASITVTAQTYATVGRSNLAVADVSGAIAAAGHKLFGPFGPEFRQPDGSVYLDFAGTTPTNVTGAVLD